MRVERLTFITDWIVRILCALIAGVLYDLAERVVLTAFRILGNGVFGKPQLLVAEVALRKLPVDDEKKESDRQNTPPV